MASKAEGLGRRAVRTGLSVFIGNIFGLMLGVATIVVLARLLGPGGYGAYTIAVSYYLLVDAAVNYGIGQYLSKNLSECSYKNDADGVMRALSSGFVWALVFSVATTLLGIGIGAYAAGVYSSSGISFTTLAIASLVILFAIPFGAATYALVGLGEGRLMAASSIIENGTQLILGAIFIRMGYGINGAIGGIVLGYFLGFIIAFAMMLAVARRYGRLRFMARKDELKASFKFCMQVAATNVMNNSVASFATLFLGIFATASLLGNYGVAMRAIGISSPIYVAIPSAILPLFAIAVSKRMSKGHFEKVCNKAISYSMLIMLPILAFIAVLSVPLVYLFVTKSYGSAPLYLALMAIGTMLDLFGVFLSSIITAGGYTRKLMKYTAFSAASQLAALLVLTPLFGAVGTIVAVFFVGSIVSTYFFAKGTAETFKIRYDYGNLGRIMASVLVFSTALMSAYLLKSSAMQLAFGCVLLILLYPLLLIATGALRKGDLKSTRKAVSTISGLTGLGFLLKGLETIART